MRTRTLTAVAALAVGSLLATACGGDDSGSSDTTAPAAEETTTTTTTEATTTMAAPTTTVAELTDLATLIGTEPQFVQLSILVTGAGLRETLAGDGPFTIFAPTNDAFAKLGADTLNSLARDPETVTPILLYHVVPAKVMAADVKPGKVTTVNGAEIEIAVDGDVVTVNGAKVVKTDIEATNGVIHVIDAVLTPPAG